MSFRDSGLSSETVATLFSNKSLELIVFPTEQCNFRCTYCYEDFEIGKMQPNIVTGLKRFLSRRAPDLELLKMDWFGGEPLLATDVIFDALEHVNALREKHALKFISGMTTNAYKLKPELLKKLVGAGVTHYQISIDGPESLHNTTRLMRGGKGSFKPIWNNLIKARESDLKFHIMLRIHLTPENINEMPLFLEEIKKTFGQDNRFSVFLKAIKNLGGPNQGKFNTLPKDSDTIIANFYKIVGEQMKPPSLKTSEPYVCYASRPNSFTIRATGEIGKCTVALSDGRNAIGRLTEEGTFIIDNPKHALWLEGTLKLDTNAMHCPYRKLPKTFPIKVEAV